MTGPENFMELRELRREIEAAEARAEEAERLLREVVEARHDMASWAVWVASVRAFLERNHKP